MSTARLQELRDQIWIHGPEHFDMDQWFASKSTQYSLSQICGLNDSIDINDRDSIDINNCGTTACMAGHGALIMRRHGIVMWINEDAVADYFDLTWIMFHTRSWVSVSVRDWNMREMYESRLDEGTDRTTAEWETVIEYLDRRIKDDR